MTRFGPSAAAYRSAVLDLCWGQWTAIGVAGVRAGERAIVDPEALLYLTSTVVDHDSRLGDEVLDWLARNERLLDLARLRRLVRSGQPTRAVGAFAARIASLAPRQGWDLLAREAAAGEATDEVPMAAESGAPWGVQAEPALRGMSTSPAAWTPAGVRFRARALVGLSARAEVLTYLWTHDWAHGRLLSERALYNQQPVAAYLAELADARLVERMPKGNRVLYRLAGDLRGLGEPAGLFVDWPPVAVSLSQLLRALEEASALDSDDAASVAVVRALSGAAPGLAAEGFGFSLSPLEGWARRGPGSLPGVVDRISARVAALAE
jgi:DNA-binding transcriptional ArsR family regulator